MSLSSCGKIAYSSPFAAWRAIRTLSDHTALFSHKRIHRRCTAYRCPLCHDWHLTHQIRLKRPNPLHSVKRLNRQWVVIEEAAL